MTLEQILNTALCVSVVLLILSGVVLLLVCAKTTWDDNAWRRH